jgi:hypothetical protein
MKTRFGARHVVAAVLAVVVAVGIVTPQVTQSALRTASQVAGPGIAEAAVPPPPATPDQATYTEKAQAYQVIGVLPTPEAVTLPDRQFVIELWRHTSPDTEVRASAELAFAGSDEDCVQFIRFGVRAARDRDEIRQAQDAEIANESRRVRKQAADALGVAVTEEQLISSDRDFIYVLEQAVAPGIVQNALLTAFGLAPPAQRQFLLIGVYDAIADQQVQAILHNAQATEAEKARVVAREARGTAAGELGIKATDEVKDKTDENFLRYIRPLTTTGTKVREGLEAAMFEEDDAARAEYIRTGIREAHQQDIDAAIKAENDRNEAALRALVQQAVASLVHPALVAAGNAALETGSPAAVRNFLRVGQWNVLAQSVRSMGRGRDMFVDESGVGPVLRRRDPAGAPGTDKRMTWQLVPGLGDPNCQSLQSVSDAHEGQYLVITGNGELGSAMDVVPSDGSDDFRDRATWCTSRLGEGVAFESKKFKPMVLSYNNDGTITLAPAYPPKDGWTSSGWLIDGPGPNAVPAITHRWNNDETLRKAVGNPTGAEVVEARYRWRPYERGRLFWTQWTGTTAVSEYLLPAYVRMMSNDRAGFYGPSIQDDLVAPDGKGRYQVFPGGGGLYYNPDAHASYATYGEIWKEWQRVGYLTSWLGYPKSDEYDITTGRRSDFQHGHIEWNRDTGVANAVRD